MKTTIDVDREVADEAAEVLGTRSLKETVNAALRHVTAAAHRRRLAERIRAGGVPVPTPAELARLRTPKVPKGLLRPGSGRARR